MVKRFFQKRQLVLLSFLCACATALMFLFISTKEPLGTQIFIQSADIQMVALRASTDKENAASAPATSKTSNQNSNTKIGILIPFLNHPRKQHASSSTFGGPSLKSIVNTLQHGYDYRIYIGIDSNERSERASTNDNSETDPVDPTGKTETNDTWKDISDMIIPVTVDSVEYAEKTNILARHAYKDGMNYFVSVNEEIIFLTKQWTTQAIAALKNLNPENVGVVIPFNSTNQQNVLSANFVHRTHMDIFYDYYPYEFSTWWIHDWITDVYKPDRCIQLNSWRVTYKHLNSASSQEKLQTKKRLLLLEVNDKRLLQTYLHPPELLPYAVSFCLYGDNPRYIDGAIINAKLMPVIYPKWQMWIYYNQSVPADVLNFLRHYKFIQLIDMTSSHWLNPMSWRFFVSSNTSIERYLIRDIDSRLTHRERVAVNEWMTSGKKFHVMRDHPNHSNFTMSGGMWGGTRIANMEELVQRRMKNGEYLRDMEFLHFTIWPHVKWSVLQHDSYACAKHGRPFPVPRHGLDYVGRVYQNKTQQNMTANEIREVTEVQEPKACQYHPIKIIILTQSGYQTLKMLLNSIQNADYNGQQVYLEIRIVPEDSYENKQTIYVATSFNFKHGSQLVYLSDDGSQPLDLLINAWRPKWNDERAIILTDDIELSPHWFRGISAIWSTQSYKIGFAAVSLCKRDLEIERTTTAAHQLDFLYHMAGPVGFAPTAKYWRRFTEWVRKTNLALQDLQIHQDEGLDLTWEHPWVRWCKMHPRLYNLYLNDTTMVTQHKI